jgi:hypothetical protein
VTSPPKRNESFSCCFSLTERKTHGIVASLDSTVPFSPLILASPQLSFHQQGQLQAAQELYQRVISHSPYRKLLLSALNNLALLFEHLGALREVKAADKLY